MNFFVDMGVVVNFLLGNGSIRFFFFGFLLLFCLVFLLVDCLLFELGLIWEVIKVRLMMKVVVTEYVIVVRKASIRETMFMVVVEFIFILVKSWLFRIIRVVISMMVGMKKMYFMIFFIFKINM